LAAPLFAQNKHARAQLDLSKKHAEDGLHASASVMLTLVSAA
jgi:hypothetical protein